MTAPSPERGSDASWQEVGDQRGRRRQAGLQLVVIGEAAQGPDDDAVTSWAAV